MKVETDSVPSFVFGECFRQLFAQPFDEAELNYLLKTHYDCTERLVCSCLFMKKESWWPLSHWIFGFSRTVNAKFLFTFELPHGTCFEKSYWMYCSPLLERSTFQMKTWLRSVSRRFFNKDFQHQWIRFSVPFVLNFQNYDRGVSKAPKLWTVSIALLFWPKVPQCLFETAAEHN